MVGVASGFTRIDDEVFDSCTPTRSINSLAAYQSFKKFEKRILVATNLFGRGMDIEKVRFLAPCQVGVACTFSIARSPCGLCTRTCQVNVVFNYDMPENSDTYLHRVARAGRFGTKGLAISFVADEEDAKILNEVQERFEVEIEELSGTIDASVYNQE